MMEYAILAAAWLFLAGPLIFGDGNYIADVKISFMVTGVISGAALAGTALVWAVLEVIS